MPPRNAELEAIFAKKDDRALADGLFCYLAAKYGNRTDDLSRLNAQEKVLTLAWHASGVIGNGGFQFFFEGAMDHVAAAKAFQVIGATAAADAMSKVIALFPNSCPAADPDARLDQYEKIENANKALIERLQTEFFAAHREIIKSCADYARRNRKAFER